MTNKRLVFRLILFIFLFILLAGIAYGSFVVYKVYSTGNKISIVPGKNQSILSTLKSLTGNSNINLRGMDHGRINILLLGIAGKGKPGQNLTDTIMVASINPKTNQVALLSIPRDFYVQVPDANINMKINSVYQYGLNTYGSEEEAANTIEKVISEITSLDIDYYAVLNFDGFIKVIDAVSGVNIMNERDIYDARYPGPNYSYETFSLSKGFQHLDGATALKYARERHDDPEGDFGRAKRQQQIMQATKNKIFSMSTMLNVVALNDLFNALGDNIKTDISPSEIESFLELAKRLDTNNINNVVVDAWNQDSLLKVSHVFFGDSRAFVLIPRVGNFSEIQDLAQNVFDLNKLNRRKQAIADENAKVVLINKSGDPSLTDKIKKLLSDNFNYKNVIILSDTNKTLKDKTIAYDLTGGTKPFTLDELVSKLPAEASYELPDYFQEVVRNVSPDITVVLGEDIKEKYNMDEDSVEDYRNANDTNEYTEFINNPPISGTGQDKKDKHK